MKLHHIAIWTFRLEELKEFYVRFFGGKSNEKYINPKKGFESYLWGIERSGFFNGREKWAKGFENQRV